MIHLSVHAHPRQIHQVRQTERKSAFPCDNIKSLAVLLTVALSNSLRSGAHLFPRDSLSPDLVLVEPWACVNCSPVLVPRFQDDNFETLVRNLRNSKAKRGSLSANSTSLPIAARGFPLSYKDDRSVPTAAVLEPATWAAGACRTHRSPRREH